MKSYYLSLLFILLFTSCKENSVEPIDNNSFNLELQVKDVNGNFLPNVNVSIWSKTGFDQNMKKVSSSNNIQAATQMRYDLIQTCFVDLSVYNLNEEKKENLVSGQYEAGAYSFQLDMHEIIGTGVYKCKIITSTDSLKKNILFQDSIYAVLWQPDAMVSLVGKTDSNGKIKITNKLLFPHLYNLPSISYTGPDGPDPIGYFTFSDSVTITLSNESFSKSISYDKVIKEGANNYQLDWTITNSKINFPKLNKDKSEIIILKKLSASLINWKLYQNYPNPFN